MSVDHLYYRWWLDERGRPWVRHECRGDFSDEVDTFEWALPNPPWSVNEEGGITPSLDCTRCGLHTFLHAADRIENPHLDRAPKPSDGPDYHADHEAWATRTGRTSGSGDDGEALS